MNGAEYETKEQYQGEREKGTNDKLEWDKQMSVYVL